MLRNEPSEWSPLSYGPVQKSNHYPIRLNSGIIIPEEFAQFRQVALENNLGDPEKLSATKDFFELQNLVMCLLNERCGFHTGRAWSVGTSTLWRRRSCLRYKQTIGGEHPRTKQMVLSVLSRRLSISPTNKAEVVLRRRY